MLEKKIEKGFDGKSLIDRLFEVSSKMPSFSHDDVKTEVGTILCGAADSSANATSTLSLMLALHPDIQERVFREVLAIMPEKDTPLTLELLSRMTFLDHCFSESLRLFPPTPIIARESTQPILLKNGVVIPPGVAIAIALRQIQTREEDWGPTALSFDPTRFEGDKLSHLPACSYIPFSYGPRNCVGEIVFKMPNAKPHSKFISISKVSLTLE